MALRFTGNSCWIASAVLVGITNAACATGEGSGPVRSDAPTAGAAWGNGASELGRNVEQEGMPEGPNSFVVDHASVVHVLDQVNHRIQVFRGGRHERSVNIPKATFTDLELDGANGYALLAPYGTPALVFVDLKGAKRAEVKLELREAPVPSLLSRLDRTDSGFWLTAEGAYRVQVCDLQGAPVEPTVLPGQAQVGSASLAARVDSRGLTLHRVAPGQEPETLSRIELDATTAHVTLLEPRPGGGAYVGLGLLGPEPGAARHWLLAVDSAGRQVGEASIDDPHGADVPDAIRRVRLGDDGRLYVMLAASTGVTIKEVTL